MMPLWRSLHSVETSLALVITCASLDLALKRMTNFDKHVMCARKCSWSRLNVNICSHALAFSVW